MPKICAVASCRLTNATAKQLGEDITLFGFPKNPELAKEWLIRCRRTKPLNIRHASICSRHFKEEDYKIVYSSDLYNLTKTKKLKSGVIPSLNLQEPDEDEDYFSLHEINEENESAVNHNLETIKKMEINMKAVQLENQMLKKQLSDNRNRFNQFTKIMSLDICRICLEENPEDRFTIYGKLPSDNLLRINDFLKTFTDLNAEENDALPQNICWHCSYLAECAFNLHKLCNKSQKYFNEILTESPTINDELTESPTINDELTESPTINDELTESPTINDESESSPTRINGEEFDINTLLDYANNTINEDENEDSKPILLIPTNEDCDDEIIINFEDGYTASEMMMITDDSFNNDHAYSLPSNDVDTNTDVEIKHEALELLARQTSLVPEPKMTEKYGVLEMNPNIKRVTDCTNFYATKIINGKKVYQCIQCQEILSRFSVFQRHYDVHLDPFYHCKFCDSVFSKQCYYKKHLVNYHTKTRFKKIHPDDDKIKEVKVQRVFNEEVVSARQPGELETDPNVKRIVDTTDKFVVKMIKGVKNFICNECGKDYRHFPNMKSHLESHMDDFYMCPYCQEKFKRQQDYRVHHGTHAGYEFKCSLCDKSFLRKTDCEIHTRFHTGERPYVCSYCGSAFITSSHLVSHERTHTGEKPYQCKQCDKAFITSHCLKKHKFSHMEDPPREHKCHLCDKAFITKTTLRQHLFVHYEKMFQCNVCKKKFTYRFELRSHMRNNCPGSAY